jgi:hypothetical protein
MDNAEDAVNTVLRKASDLCGMRLTLCLQGILLVIVCIPVAFMIVRSRRQVVPTKANADLSSTADALLMTIQTSSGKGDGLLSISLSLSFPLSPRISSVRVSALRPRKSGLQAKLQSKRRASQH